MCLRSGCLCVSATVCPSVCERECAFPRVPLASRWLRKPRSSCGGGGGGRDHRCWPAVGLHCWPQPLPFSARLFVGGAAAAGRVRPTPLLASSPKRRLRARCPTGRPPAPNESHRSFRAAVIILCAPSWEGESEKPSGRPKWQRPTSNWRPNKRFTPKPESRQFHATFGRPTQAVRRRRQRRRPPPLGQPDSRGQHRWLARRPPGAGRAEMRR